MISPRTTLTLALAALAFSCGGSAAPDPGTTPTRPDPRPIGNTVDVAIASVTLAEDCGSGPTGVPVASAPAATAGDEPAHGTTTKPSRKMAPGVAASQSGDVAQRRACMQSALQLRVENGSTEPGTISIKKIEIIGEGGTVVGELTSRAPSQWAADSYQPWDEHVAPSGVLQVSYALSSVPLEAGTEYTVRVTIDAGTGESTLEQKATTLQLEGWGSLPPGAVT